MKRKFAVYSFVFCIGYVAGAQGADSNLIVNPGLESQEQFNWTGTSALIERVQTSPHSGGWCLSVKDNSNSLSGRGVSRLLPVHLRGGGRYYAEVWVRIDNESESRTGYGALTVDMQFFDHNGKYLSTQNVGSTMHSYQWARLSAILTLPDDASIVAFSVSPAGNVPELVGDAFADDFYLAELTDAYADDRVKLATVPQPPKGAPEYKVTPRPTDGSNMALSIEKLTKGFDPPRPFVIWALGSSFTEFLGNGDELIEAIRQRFPNAPRIVYKVMEGGSTPYHLLRGWANHLAIPDQPDVVLLYNFGTTEGLEKVIVALRTYTTTDIIVPTLHWNGNHAVVWPDPDAENHHSDPISLRKMSERHNVEFVENRRDITKYMIANDLEIKDLLVDQNHQSPYAAKIINKNIAQHFNKADNPSYDPRSRQRRIEAETLSTISNDWTPANNGNALVADGKASSIEVKFTGTRIDLIGWRDPRAGSVNIWIDGKPADKAEVYYATYVQPGQDNFINLKSPLVDFRRVISDRCPHGITIGSNVVPQKWTITMTSEKGDYNLVGSVTGHDGKGYAFKPFTSQSGQIIVEPELWRLANTNRTGDKFTFKVYRCAQSRVDLAGSTEKFCERLVQNLPPGQHSLRLEANGDGPVTIDAFDVFEPSYQRGGE